jgi:hypothetical protein
LRRGNKLQFKCSLFLLEEREFKSEVLEEISSEYIIVEIFLSEILKIMIFKIKKSDLLFGLDILEIRRILSWKDYS